MSPEQYDVVVLGTGAAGLTAALAAAQAGARVGLFEKAELLGGTTALSGGVIWLPDNPVARAEGVPDSRDDALAYLTALSNDTMREEMVEAFVDTVDELVEWLGSKTPVRLKLVARYPDYHPEHPGGRPDGGRSLESHLVCTDPIGEWVDRLAGSPRRMLIGEIPSGGGTGVLPPGVREERDAKHLEGLGRGLVASLLEGCLEAGVLPRTGWRATRLLEEDGHVVGVQLAGSSGELVVRARSVVIATGGFEWDHDLVQAFLRGPIEHPPTARGNTGDGLRMAMRAGAELGSMQFAWWVPVVTPPGLVDAAGEPTSTLLLRERTLPGTVMVNRQGVRFANEAANYNALGAAFHAFDPVSFSYANIPAWLILDSRCVDQYGCFGTAAGQAPPDWLVRADGLAELAEAIDVPAEALVATLARFNEHVDAGHDPDFSRGESRYDGWCGDQRHYGTPQATLGRLDTAPYFAVQVHPSTLGTKGGPRTTVDGEVVHVTGATIPGLYAVGNAMAAPTGIAYGGAGGTLGPAMVFGYRAGRAAAQAR
jgi:succinate dehydrogenase/fumarate reductase flavoprotein subunit